MYIALIIKHIQEIACVQNFTLIHCSPPQALRDIPWASVFCNGIAFGEPLTDDIDIMEVMHVCTVV